MTINMMPVMRIQQSFLRWKEARETLLKIGERISGQDAILTPSEAMIPPEIFSAYARIFVNAARVEFCRQILMCNKRWRDRSIYEVYAQWDNEENAPIEETVWYQCNLVWDCVTPVEKFGFAICIMMTNVAGYVQKTLPIPIDKVDMVRGLVPIIY